MNPIFRSLPRLFLFFLMLLASIAVAHSLIDQAFDDLAIFDPNQSTRGVTPLPGYSYGQRFVPTRNALDGIDVALRGNPYLSEGVPHDLIIEIRELASDGSSTLVGSSAGTVAPNYGAEWFHFDFIPALPLIPGQRYAMKFFEPTGTGDYDSVHLPYWGGYDPSLNTGLIYFYDGVHYIDYTGYYSFFIRTYGHDVDESAAGQLIGSGVPGNGLADAPGLQREFNSKSSAADNAGRK